MLSYGSVPGLIRYPDTHVRVAELVDAEGLNPSGGKPPYGFKPRPGHVNHAS
jgi:hypothetical protein